MGAGMDSNFKAATPITAPVYNPADYDSVCMSARRPGHGASARSSYSKLNNHTGSSYPLDACGTSQLSSQTRDKL
jgi:hypothetical protein